ncbi:MAG: hypothetical protein ACFB10_03010 [Salibacteraceae bacterium]
MKTITFPTCKALVLLLASWCLLASAQAQMLEESRSFTRTYRVDRNVTVDVSNKYGKIHFINWNKDSVKVEVDVTISARHLEKLERLKGSIDFDFTQSTSYVTLHTLIKDTKNPFISDLESIFSQGTSVEINYRIYLPGMANLQVENKYGDVFCDKVSGDAYINLAHGDLRASDFDGRDTRLQIRFGNARINHLRNGRLDLQYVENFNLKKAGELNITSKSSNVYIDQADELRLNSKRDEYHLQKVEKIKGDCGASNIMIEEVEKEIVLEMKYGLLEVEGFANNFFYLNLDTRYTDLNFRLGNDFSYQLDLTHKNVSLDYPQTLGNLDTKTAADDRTQNSIGVIGVNKSTSRKFRITAESCDVRFIHL